MTLGRVAPPAFVINPAWASLPLFDRTGWKRVRFGDVVENCAETCDPEEAGLERFVAMEHLEPGSLHVRSWGNVADGTTFTRRCRPGQVLFGKRRAYQRKVAVAEFEAVVSGDIYVLAPKDDRLLPELLPFLCLSERFFQHAVGTSAGSLSPRTNWSSLASFEFDLPPLDQQRRIAEILWAVDASLQAQLKLVESVECVLARRGDQLFWDEQPVRHSAGEAKATTYGEVTHRITYGFTNPMPTTDDGPWMVTAKDVLDGRIDYSTARHTSQEAYETLLTAKSRPKPGDVLLTKDGTIGRVSLVDRSDLCISQSVALLEPNLDLITSEFLSWSLRSQRMQKKLIDDAGGSAIKHIYITKVAVTPLRVPSLETQRRVTDELDRISSACLATGKQVEASQMLLQSLINQFV